MKTFAEATLFVDVDRRTAASRPTSKSSRSCSPRRSATSPPCVLRAVRGMRRGELASLRRSDINAERLEIAVAGASDRSRLKATKTRRRRTVQIDAGREMPAGIGRGSTTGQRAA